MFQLIPAILGQPRGRVLIGMVSPCQQMEKFKQRWQMVDKSMFLAEILSQFVPLLVLAIILPAKLASQLTQIVHQLDRVVMEKLVISAPLAILGMVVHALKPIATSPPTSTPTHPPVAHLLSPTSMPQSTRAKDQSNAAIKTAMEEQSLIPMPMKNVSSIVPIPLPAPITQKST